MKTYRFQIKGMHCAACQNHIEKAVKKLTGVKKTDINLLANQMTVLFDESLVTKEDIINAVIEAGYGVFADVDLENDNSFNSRWKKRKEYEEEVKNNLKYRFLFSLVILIPLMYISMGAVINLPEIQINKDSYSNRIILSFIQLFFALLIIIINRGIFTGGIKALLKRKPNMDSLVAIGSGASFIYGLFAIFQMLGSVIINNIELFEKYSNLLYFESSAMILTLVTLGKYLEAGSKNKTTEALEKLIELTPPATTVIREGKEINISSDKVKTGDTVLIKPGQIIPVDGIITEGIGYVDQSTITGESIPVEKSTGDGVISATINKNGCFKFKATNVGEETTISKIIQLIDEAGNSKSPSSRLADKASEFFVPAVIIAALITFIIWILLGYNFEFAFNCAVSILVISCPCALGLATPAAIMTGVGKAAEYGILVRSAQSLENLHNADTIVFDKTGTLTYGEPEVTDIKILKDNISEYDLLKIVSCIEAGSEHPIAKAIIKKAKDFNIDVKNPDIFQVVSGCGIKAEINNKKYIAGNARFMMENNVLSDGDDIFNIYTEQYAKEAKTPVFVSENNEITGIIAISDKIRESSKETIKYFKNKLKMDIVLLTGDNKYTANAVCKALDIDRVVSEVLPADKDRVINSLQKEGHNVIMVGDGINDAPALFRANTGIAISSGSDIAIDSADIILMKNSLSDIITAINLSRAVVKNIRENLFWAFFYNIIGIPIAAGVLYSSFNILLNPVISAAAMSLSSVCVVSNALRLRFFNNRSILNFCVDNKQNLEVKMKKEIIIEGMACEHCSRNVENALRNIDEISDVNVNLKEKKAIIVLTKDIQDNKLFEVIKKAGYTPVRVKKITS